MTTLAKIELLLYGLCSTPVMMLAQQFRYTAELQRVDTAGFYSIAIHPPVSALIRLDAADLRIVDEHNQWVPHIFQNGRGQRPFAQADVYHDNPVPVIKQAEKGKLSVVSVQQDAAYPFDSLILQVSGPKFYDREIDICLPFTGKGQRNKLYGNLISSSRLVASSPLAVGLPRTKVRMFFIVIKNGDNPPLNITAVHTRQRSLFLAAYLERDRKYAMVFGDSLVQSPADYDLQTFRDSIIQVRSLSYGKIQSNPAAITEKIDKAQQYWLWTVIITAGIILSFLTWRLTSGIPKASKS